MQSASEIGTAVFAGMSSLAALGVESVSEVGLAALASSFAPAATGVESASEIGAAVFLGMSAPAATGVESASEIGTASPPSADTTAPVMTSDSYDEGTTTFSATITETESLPVTMHVLVSDTEPTTTDDIINGTGLLKTTYTVTSGANSEELEFSTVAAGTHWLGVLPVDAVGNSAFAQAHVVQYTFPGGYVATGVESTSEVGTAVFASMAAPAATGVESTSEVGSAAVASVSAPAATGVESASEVGTATAPAGGSTSLTMLADLYNETNATSYTIGSQTEANIICVVGRRAFSANAAPSSVTMNGNTCTELASSAFGTDVISFWKCPDADGSSSGDLVVNFPAEQDRMFVRSAYVEGFDLSGAVSDSSFDLNNDNGAGSLSLDCPAGGLIFAVARLHTFNGDLANDEASSYEVPAAWEIFAGAQTAFSITLNNTAQNDQLGGAISLAAA